MKPYIRLLLMITILMVVVSFSGCTTLTNPLSSQPSAEDWQLLKIKMNDGVSNETAETMRSLIESRFSGFSENYTVLLEPPESGVHRYLVINYSGINQTIAKRLATSEGKFEMTMDSTNGQRQLLIDNSDLVKNSIVVISNSESPENRKFTDKYVVGIKITEAGAKKFQRLANNLGATTNPEEHKISIILDDEVLQYSPLSSGSGGGADKLKTDIVDSFAIPAGKGEYGRINSQFIAQILKFGPLPVEATQV